MKRKYTVLLADDDKVQTMMLSSQLRAKGFSVAAAYDATYTFMVAMKSPPDIVVLDIQMPGGTGRAVLERLKGSSKTMQIPVVVLSSIADPTVVREVLALGATEYLHKPANIEVLVAALQRALGLPVDPPAADAPAAPPSTPPASAPSTP
ncbi:MAG: response regulator [Gemmatimonadota bacterium]|nr:response regulator [Gemmatimonadota bacterium]